MSQRRCRAIAQIALFIALAPAMAPQPATAQSNYDLPIREHVLDNGLRLLVLERPGDPRVAAKIFTDMQADLPTPTLVLMSVSRFLERRWWVIFLVIFLVVVGLRLWGRTDAGRRAIDRAKLRIPLFGTLIRKVVVARFASTLSTLMASGVPLLAGLDIVRSIVLNRIFEDAIGEVRGHVQEGGGIATGLRATGEFPAIVLHMVDVGERSGSLEEMLERVAGAYEEDVEVTVSALTSLVEPVMIVVLGLLVLFIVLAILLPIFEINELIH